uniref:Uncharacterized protein n=1 Tax=Cacopsylla melanoneura TaxID=428564 RepID=A0A8D8W1I9_9HEMI
MVLQNTPLTKNSQKHWKHSVYETVMGISGSNLSERHIPRYSTVPKVHVNRISASASKMSHKIFQNSAWKCQRNLYSIEILNYLIPTLKKIPITRIHLSTQSQFTTLITRIHPSTHIQFTTQITQIHP